MKIPLSSWLVLAIAVVDTSAHAETTPPPPLTTTAAGGLRNLQTSFNSGCDDRRITIDFSRDATGVLLSKGDRIDDTRLFDGGVYFRVRKHNDNDGAEFNDGMIFDGRTVTGRDDDLGNFPFLGNMLIVAANEENQDNPDDAAVGGQIFIHFASNSTLHSIRFIDVENTNNGDSRKSDITLLRENDEKLRGVRVTGMMDGGQKVMTFAQEKMGLRSVKINMGGSGAIDDVVFSRDCEEEQETESTVCCPIDPPRFYAEECLYGTIFCCPGGGYFGCVNVDSFEETVTCPHNGVTYVNSLGRNPLYRQQGKLCGDACDGLSEVEIENLGLLCGPKKTCPDPHDSISCPDGTLRYRDPLIDCEFRPCEETLCCDPSREPKFGKWIDENNTPFPPVNPGGCRDGAFCCPDGQWTCMSESFTNFGLFSSCISRFTNYADSGNDFSGHNRGTVCPNECPDDEMQCPNVDLFVVRDSENNCEFMPCPDNTKCCDPLLKPGDLGNPDCVAPDEYSGLADAFFKCCPDGNWKCDYEVPDDNFPVAFTLECNGYGVFLADGPGGGEECP